MSTGGAIMVTDGQVIALWKEFRKSKVIKIAALKNGMNRKTAAKYLQNYNLPSETVIIRNWRTRPDNLKGVWPKAEEFLAITPDIEAKALFEHLQEVHPLLLNQVQLRTFQRRVKQWRIQNGTNQEVFFDQKTIPARMAQLDWVDMNKFKITINGMLFKHKLCHFTLNHSNVESATICSSESMLAIKKGLRDFLYRVLGKAPQILQVDNSSAATHRPCKDKKKRVFNSEYVQVLEYYGIEAQKTNISKPNENGVVESQNGHLKNKVKQALTIRGSKNFANTQQYQKFINDIIDKANGKRKAKLEEELPLLRDIPAKPLPEYQEEYITIRNRSTVFIKRITYSVPSRLIGSKIKARIYEDRIDLYSGINLVFSMPRIFGSQGVVIDYRHIIHSLIRKPAAFENYKYREELFPTINFKKAWDYLNKSQTLRQATVEYLRILKLAAENSERDIDVALELLLADSESALSSISVADLAITPLKIQVESMTLEPDLGIYDQLFLNRGETNNEEHYQ